MNPLTQAAIAAPEEPPQEKPNDRLPAPTRTPAIISAVVAAAIAGLSIWYLVRPEALLVQGEADATRLDIEARVDGRVGDTRCSAARMSPPGTC